MRVTLNNVRLQLTREYRTIDDMLVAARRALLRFRAPGVARAAWWLHVPFLDVDGKHHVAVLGKAGRTWRFGNVDGPLFELTAGRPEAPTAEKLFDYIAREYNLRTPITRVRAVMLASDRTYDVEALATTAGGWHVILVEEDLF